MLPLARADHRAGAEPGSELPRMEAVPRQPRAPWLIGGGLSTQRRVRHSLVKDGADPGTCPHAISLVWPVSWCRSAPVRASQIRAVPSSLAVAMVAPSGAKAADHTVPVWPVSWRSSAPVGASQIRAVLSPRAVAMVVPHQATFARG